MLLYGQRSDLTGPTVGVQHILRCGKSQTYSHKHHPPEKAPEK